MYLQQRLCRDTWLSELGGKVLNFLPGFSSIICSQRSPCSVSDAVSDAACLLLLTSVEVLSKVDKVKQHLGYTWLARVTSSGAWCEVMGFQLECKSVLRAAGQAG